MTKSDRTATTLVVRRPAKVQTDSRGRNVWANPVEETELDLMSTQELQQVLQAASKVDRETIRAIAESSRNGVIARDRSTGLYDVVSEAELQQLLASDAGLSASIRQHEMVPDSADADSEDELSLVSTQALRLMLKQDEPDAPSDLQEVDTGFDPYDKKSI